LKLPTLNVDVAVNTKTMQKGIADANKQLEKVGKKGLAFAGGSFGKIGSLAELGGGFGMGAIGAGGLALAALAPIKLASFAVDAFAEATKRGEEALKSFAEGRGLTGGLDLGAASRLALAAPEAMVNANASKGLIDTFIAAGLNEQGQTGGLSGLIYDWAVATAEGTKWVTALIGAFAGGRTDYAYETADMAISRSAAGAQAYMTPEQINEIANQAERLRKSTREQNT
jgi:hypothetical protein